MLGRGRSGVGAGAAGAGAGAGAAVVTAGAGVGATGFGATGMVAWGCMERSKVRGVEDAAESFCTGWKPNIRTVNLHEVEGKPPISKRPASSVVVVILLSVPH